MPVLVKHVVFIRENIFLPKKYESWGVVILQPVAYLQKRRNIWLPCKTLRPPQLENKKRESTLRKNVVVFKGNMTAKTSLIDNKEQIASRIIPRLEHCNENAQQVLRY